MWSLGPCGWLFFWVMSRPTILVTLIDSTGVQKTFLIEGLDLDCDCAYDTGFKLLSQFNRVFKYLNGFSPAEYRKNAQ